MTDDELPPAASSKRPSKGAESSSKDTSPPKKLKSDASKGKGGAKPGAKQQKSLMGFFGKK